MRQVAGEHCADGETCAGIFEDGDTVVFRGDVVSEETLARGSSEAAVRLPKALLDEYLERR
jgi:hypothetical protein